MDNKQIMERFPQIVSITNYQEGPTSHFVTLTSSGVKLEGEPDKMFRSQELCEDSFDCELRKFLSANIKPFRRYRLEWRMIPEVKSYQFIENQEDNPVFVLGPIKDVFRKVCRLALIEMNLGGENAQ